MLEDEAAMKINPVLCLTIQFIGALWKYFLIPKKMKTVTNWGIYEWQLSWKSWVGGYLYRWRIFYIISFFFNQSENILETHCFLHKGVSENDYFEI